MGHSLIVKRKAHRGVDYVCVFCERQGRCQQPHRAGRSARDLPGCLLVMLVLRRGWGAGFASGIGLRSYGILWTALAPIRRTECLRDGGRGGAGVGLLRDGPKVLRFGDEDDDPQGGPQPRLA